MKRDWLDKILYPTPGSLWDTLFTTSLVILVIAIPALCWLISRLFGHPL